MCIENQLKEIKDAVKNLEDSNQKTIISCRDSVPPSLSDVLMRLSLSIDRLHKKVDSIEQTLTPIAKKFNDTQGFWRIFMAIAKYAGGSAAIWYILDLVMTHFKIDKLK